MHIVYLHDNLSICIKQVRFFFCLGITPKGGVAGILVRRTRL